MSIGVADIVFVFIILILVIRAVYRGFVREVMGMVAVVGGVIMGLVFSPWLTERMGETFSSSKWNPLIAFLSIFLATYLVVKILESLISSVLERLMLTNLDRALGLFLGLLEGVIVVVMLIFIVQIQPLIEPDKILEDSAIAKLVLPFLPIGLTILGRVITTLR